MILHLTNDFSGSTVYKNLVDELDKLKNSQIVYTPIRESNRINKNKVNLEVEGSQIIYSHILNKYSDRVFYYQKISKIVSDVEKKIDLSEIGVIHAHTWYSDGGVAYKLFKMYNIPYIVTIRNTDINIFLKHLFYLRSFGKEILRNASKIIFISPRYKSRLLKYSHLSEIANCIHDNSILIPNGVDLFWIENAISKVSLEKKNPVNIIYIGKFAKGKNVLTLIEAVKKVNRRSDVFLTLIGGGGDIHKAVVKLVKQNQSLIFYHGKIFDPNILKEYFKNADIFAMPSKHETFGLVYIEALLQGLPILYTANEGIDGFYSENIGEKVVYGDVDEIAQKLEKMIEEYDTYTIPTDKIKENHNWSHIALTYQKIYNEIR